MFFKNLFSSDNENEKLNKQTTSNDKETYTIAEIIEGAKNGKLDFQHTLGNLYEHGLYGVENDLSQAIYWFEKAAQQGYGLSQYKLAININDYDKKIFWLKKAADQNVAAAQTYLGFIYKIGLYGLEKDPKKAVELYNKAISQGYTEAMNHLGFCYELGDGVEKNRTIALEWFKKSAELNDLDGMYQLAKYYEYGFDTCEIDEKKAFELYEKLTNLGYENAIGSLACCYEFGTVIEKDELKAYNLYKKACDNGSIGAYYSLAMFYKKGKVVKQDYKIAFELFNVVIENSNNSYTSVSLEEIGKFYENGFYVNKDINKAIEFYQKAVNCNTYKCEYAEERLKVLNSST